MPPTLEDLKKRLVNDFTYHPPTLEQVERYQQIRDKALEFALLIASITPMSSEQSIAFTCLDQVVTSANSAIARNESASAI